MFLSVDGLGVARWELPVPPTFSTIRPSTWSLGGCITSHVKYSSKVTGFGLQAGLPEPEPFFCPASAPTPTLL